jgi:hypothetical protein
MVAKQEDVSVYALLNRAVWHFRNWQERGNKILEEVLKAIDDVCCEYNKQMRRRRYFEREYKVQLWRQRNLRRKYERLLWQERNLRRKYEQQLRHERDLRRKYEKQVQRQRDYYERHRTAEETGHDALYELKIGKLVALALRSDSDGEAAAAFAKARQLHHVATLSRLSTDRRENQREPSDL